MTYAGIVIHQEAIGAKLRCGGVVGSSNQVTDIGGVIRIKSPAAVTIALLELHLQ